ncbi:MAG: protease modulator HflC [Thermodesulfobacteriota bacterium]
MVRIAIILLAVVIVISQATFTISELEQGLVLEFGKHKRTVIDPGLYFKVPFVQDVVRLEKRILYADSDPKEYLTLDKKRLIVDTVSRWRISDPLLFFQAMRDNRSAVIRLNDTISTRLRQHIAGHLFGDFIKEQKETSKPAPPASAETPAVAGTPAPKPEKPAPSPEVLSQREKIMARVTKEAAEQSKEAGISVIDVRIKRVDLPKEVQASVYARMKAERERQAKLYRAEGDEISREIKAKADKNREVILAKAYEKAQELKGQGDASATTVYAEAYGKDPEFYSFLRHMEVYERVFPSGTTVLLRPDSDLMRFLATPAFKPQQAPGQAPTPAPAATKPPADALAPAR